MHVGGELVDVRLPDLLLLLSRMACGLLSPEVLSVSSSELYAAAWNACSRLSSSFASTLRHCPYNFHRKQPPKRV
jgi:hypothetical protein